MDPLIQLLLGIVAAFVAGAAGSAAVILINDRKMAAVERVKRRILHGPEKPLFAVDVGGLDRTQWAAMIRSVSVPPIPHRAMKDIMNTTQKEFEEWRRESKSKSK